MKKLFASVMLAAVLAVVGFAAPASAAPKSFDSDKKVSVAKIGNWPHSDENSSIAIGNWPHSDASSSIMIGNWPH